jgi:DNA-binding winged helix-turn-helix (wHTH) protein
LGGFDVSNRFGAFVFHPERRQLLRQDEEVHLTPKAFDLLALLIERAPSVVSKTELHKQLWPGTFVSDATLVGLVKELRRALRDDGEGAAIRTAHRIGYAFARSAHTEADPPPRRVTHWLVAGKRHIPLQEGVNVIGRDAESTVWLDVPGVSRRHAQITIAGGSATLEDLGSKNGTLVGDRPVRGSMVLRNADRIQVVTELLVVHISDSGMSTATQPVTPSSSPSDSR